MSNIIKIKNIFITSILLICATTFGQPNDAIAKKSSIAFGKLAMGDSIACLKLCQEILNEFPQDAQSYDWMSFYYLIIGDFNNAIYYANKAIEISPKNGTYYIVRGLAKAHLKKYDDALKDQLMQISLQKEKNHSLTYINIAEILSYQNKLADALFYLNEFLNQKIKDFDYGYFKRAIVKYKKGEYKQALSDIQTATGYLPQIKIAAHYNGLCYLGLKNYAKALNILTEATKQKYVFRDTYYYLAVCYDSLKSNTNAKIWYTKYIQEQQKFTERYKSEKRKWFYTKYFPTLNITDDTLTNKPLLAEAYTARGRAQSLTGNTKEAFTDFEKSIKADANYAEAYYQRALVHLTANNKKAACADLKKALELGHTKAAALWEKECK